ncbi:MAG: hypothetical protein A3K05_01410 [Candidatus Doudnabacteria bacterium RIFCSPHIGHO2_01_48_18]|nr:MAG: hypothetical protein A3K05_01410 [Candidatus Doudnabacteria bacterium RIFCSPHIGHO2_01_48_18]OGE77540.1 MAG: hypothetical protein A2668_03605 [Candidatus Doudnabacteria bacterium RIFCSPHIGHO2_01_FULL_48_180]OGE91681.1 MAG: hypothetical protein A3F44_03165 [Candidatus Doudnabacteria bacterium RIFCSPHIGHO2_12_FULL_47_25]OGF02146.1 MAG: hypothetical protein A3G07_03405 [Candidatus Doudnabacteria bacterium RIFCSPLOWO2_12_FULL_47_12]
MALVIVAAIAATAGYLVWAKAHEAWPYDNETPQTLENPSNSSLSEVEGWQTYRNEEYGFQVRVPNEWTHHEEYSATKPSSKVLIMKSNDEKEMLTISTNPLETGIVGYEDLKTDDILVDGVRATRQFFQSSADKSFVEVWVIFDRKRPNSSAVDAYLITYSPSSKVLEAITSKLDQILSTFKFIK